MKTRYFTRLYFGIDSFVSIILCIWCLHTNSCLFFYLQKAFSNYIPNFLMFFFFRSYLCALIKHIYYSIVGMSMCLLYLFYTTIMSYISLVFLKSFCFILFTLLISRLCVYYFSFPWYFLDLLFYWTLLTHILLSYHVSFEYLPSCKGFMWEQLLYYYRF